MTADLVRRAVLFVLGVAILAGEVWGNDHIRPLVVALALVLVGVVTFDQISAWLTAKPWPSMPVRDGPVHPQEPPLTPPAQIRSKPRDGPDDPTPTAGA